MPAKPVDTIVPFWNRLPKVMSYPAHGAAMASIVLFALARLLLYVPFGFILVVLAGMAMYRYAFECLQSTADGFMEPPEVTGSTDRSLARKFIWLLVILAVAAGFGIGILGRGPGTILAIFIGLSLPGATMTLAMEQSLGEALNPLKWVAIFAAIGWPYLAVVGVCLAIFLSEGYATLFVSKIMPQAVALVVIGIISNYALLMVFHLMGYILYQFHEELGLSPIAQQIDRPGAVFNPDQEKLDEIGALVREGKIEEATANLRSQIARGATPAVHAQYRKLLRASDDKTGLLDHGRDRIGYLIDQNEERAAVDLLRDCQLIDPAFSPATAGHVTKLAYMAERQKQPQAALLLVKDFEQRFPKSQYIPQASLLAAEILHEHLGRDEEACVLLKRLKEIAPNDPLMPEIDARLVSVERMIAATKKPGPVQS